MVNTSHLKRQQSLVDCFVYFHHSDKRAINSLYYPAENKQKEEQHKLNQLFQTKSMNYDSYERASNYLDNKKRNLQRDKFMSFGSDGLALLVKKINQKSKDLLFDENIYNDFKRRLSPPDHTLHQGIAINFDKKQLHLTKSKRGKEKIIGIAGCGKTSILSQRAINAHQRHNSSVLILTFNITLKNHIRDKISDIQGSRDFSSFEITNYHQFYNSQVNNTEEDIAELTERYGRERLYSIDVFQNSDVRKYQTILLDEVQDYEPYWVRIIRDNFLSEDGEMVLFEDNFQNIYQRNIGRARIILQGFGRWVKLNQSYRTSSNSPLNKLFENFQMQYLVVKYPDSEITNTSQKQIGFEFEFELELNLLKYEPIPVSGWSTAVFDSIQSYIRTYDLHPNDVVVLSSQTSLIRQLNQFWVEKEKTHCMFETYEELSVCTHKGIDELKKLDENEINTLVKENKGSIERVRRAKKNHFYSNSGLIKLSTIHSFKGLESKTVFYVMCEKDDAEVIYTSITRSSENLVVFDLGSKNICSDFLAQHIEHQL